MTYVYNILRDNPIAVYPLDSGVTDVSGFNRDGATTGTPTADRPLTARGIAAQYLDTAGFTYPITDIMVQNKQLKSFSLEAWVKPHNATGLANILARNTSGLFIDEGILFFQVASPSVITSVEYDWLDVGRTAHVVGVYDANDIYLYVNGEVVASASVDESILTDSLMDTAANLVTNTSGGAKMTVDTVAIYNYPLSSKTIQSHYSVGTSYPAVADISKANGGHVYFMNADSASVRVALNIDTDVEWQDADYVNAGSIDGELINLTDPTTGDYAAAVWEKSISFAAETGVILEGSSLTWEASPGVVVSTALNDDAYVVLANGGQPFAGLDITTDQTLKIRIELPTGTEQSTVKYMTFRAYTSKAIRGSDEEVAMTLTSPANVDLDVFAYNPVEFNDFGGMKLTTATGISIAADANFGGYTAVEFTVFMDANAVSKTLFAAGTHTITTNASGQWVPTGLTALIVDGVVISAATTITLNRWHHVIAIFAEQTSSITFLTGVASRLGYLATYTSQMAALTTAGAQDIYNNWVGAPALQLVDAAVITVSESDAKAYTYDWAIQPAG
jgi:hypothetical protein